MSNNASLTYTSTLPFAARHCDLPALDLMKRFRSVEVERLETVAFDDDSPVVEFAWRVSGVGDRMSQIDDLLNVVSSLFEKAYRGDSTEHTPGVCFDRAMRLLALSRELLEAATLDGDEALGRVSADMVKLRNPASKAKPKTTPTTKPAPPG